MISLVQSVMTRLAVSATAACAIVLSATPTSAADVPDAAPAGGEVAGEIWFQQSGRATRPPSPEQIDRAIERGVNYIFSRQNADGLWETAPQPRPPRQGEGVNWQMLQDVQAGQWGGPTSMAVYALLTAGVEPGDPRLSRGIEFVKTADVRGVYAVGLRMLALSKLPIDDQIRRTVAQDAQLLLNSVKRAGDASGHYDYNVAYRQTPAGYSHSRTQYALLGMWAAAQMGYEVPVAWWQLVDQGWRRNQYPDGPWGYTHPRGAQMPVSPGMTAAAVASLFITNDYLLGDRARQCQGNVVDPSILAGINYLAREFDKLEPDTNYPRAFHYVTLYAVERVGIASGLRYIGQHDWYGRGAGWLVRHQSGNGSWNRGPIGAVPASVTQVTDTGFALLFLARGRSPVVANKLAYTADVRNNRVEAAWNQRPRDLANLAAFTGEQVERELHWQIVNEDRDLSEWHESAVLFVAGSEALTLSEQTKQKIRDYALQGGLIVLHADCGRRPFAQSAEALAAELFPDYAPRVLDREHLLNTIQYRLDSRRPPQITGVSNGVRELMLVVPTQDLARDWQTGAGRRRDSEALQFGANLILYSVDRQYFFNKGVTHLVTKDSSKNPTRRVTAGRLRHDGNWNPEPAGWDRLTTVLHNAYGTALTVRDVTDDFAGLDVLHLTGTGDLELDDAARDRIRGFVEAGGLLFVDAAGGDRTFAAAAERELQRLFGDKANALSQPLAAGHPLFAQAQGIPDLEVSYRLDALSTLGAARAPRLRGIEFDGRLGVVYSPEDVSAGLVGQHVAGIFGYNPDTATALAARVVRSAAAQ